MNWPRFDLSFGDFGEVLSTETGREALLDGAQFSRIVGNLTEVGRGVQEVPRTTWWLVIVCSKKKSGGHLRLI